MYRGGHERAGLGVQKLITGTTLHLDMGKILRRLGYHATETAYTEYIVGQTNSATRASASGAL